jgi:hypothetical protein
MFTLIQIETALNCLADQIERFAIMLHSTQFKKNPSYHFKRVNANTVKTYRRLLVRALTYCLLLLFKLRESLIQTAALYYHTQLITVYMCTTAIMSSKKTQTV